MSPSQAGTKNATRTPFSWCAMMPTLTMAASSAAPSAAAASANALRVAPGAPHRDADAEHDERDRPGRAQQDVLVAVRDDVIGEHPGVEEKAADEPDREPPERVRIPTATRAPRDRRADPPRPTKSIPSAEAHREEARARTRGGCSQRRRTGRLEQPPARRTPAARRREPARQLLGEVHLAPSDRSADHRRPQHQVEREVEPERLRRHAQRVPAQGQPPGRRRRWRAGARPATPSTASRTRVEQLSRK